MSAQGAPKKRRRWIWWVVAAVVLVAAAVIVVPMFGGSSSDLSQYSTAQVAKSDLRVTVSGSGNAIVGSAVSVDPGISGTVEDLSVKLGQTVKAGQVLFKVVNADLDAAVVRAEVGYKQAQQQVTQAQISLQQSKNNLYALQHPSSTGTQPVRTPTASELKLAKLQVTNAQAGVSTANQNLDSASLALSQARDTADKRTVTAPVAGMVTVLNAQNGRSLGSSSGNAGGSSASGSSSSAPIEISDMSTVRASVSINEVDLVSVKVGQKAAVTFDALPGVTVTGTVSAIAPTGSSSSGVVTYQVDLTLASIDPRLRPGMSCSAEIETAVEKGALTVPSSAVKSSGGKTYVQVLDIGATAPRQVEVTTGKTVGTITEILTGVKAGEYVATGTSTATSTGTSSSGGRPGGVGMIFGGGR